LQSELTHCFHSDNRLSSSMYHEAVLEFIHKISSSYCRLQFQPLFTTTFWRQFSSIQKWILNPEIWNRLDWGLFCLLQFLAFQKSI